MDKNAIVRKALFNFLSFSSSDYLSQVIENYYINKNGKGRRAIQVQRMLQHGLLGVAMTPIYHFQYSVLEPALFKPGQYLRRMLFDQVLCCPIQNTVFFAVQGLIQGHSLNKTKQRIKALSISSTIDGYKVWPLLTGLTFKYLPPRYTEYSFSLLGMLWGVYLSYIGHKQ